MVLIWVLRGAVPGKSVEGESDSDSNSDSDSPRRLHPDRIVFGVATGLVLILVGAGVAIGRGIPWSLPVFAAGFGLVLFLTEDQPTLSPFQPDRAPARSTSPAHSWTSRSWRAS